VDSGTLTGQGYPWPSVVFLVTTPGPYTTIYWRKRV
jgi:hypothetical protein